MCMYKEAAAAAAAGSCYTQTGQAGPKGEGFRGTQNPLSVYMSARNFKHRLTGLMRRTST